MAVWQYEIRQMGWKMLGFPPLVLVVMGCLAVLTHVLGSANEVNHILSNTLDVLPLAAAVGAAVVVGLDPALELQLSLPCHFHLTVLRRLALLLGSAILSSAGATAILQATGRLIWPVPPVASELIWLPPLLWMAGVGALIAVWSGTAVGSGTAAVVWTVEAVLGSLLAQISWLKPVWMFMRYPTAPLATWYWNRFALLAFSVVLFVGIFLSLDNFKRFL